MLVLSRKSTESIHVGDSVVVTVLEIRGNKVRLGIEAPKEVHVVRSELKDVIFRLPSSFVGESS
jgi:carbon storage regulator